MRNSRMLVLRAFIADFVMIYLLRFIQYSRAFLSSERINKRAHYKHVSFDLSEIIFFINFTQTLALSTYSFLEYTDGFWENS